LAIGVIAIRRQRAGQVFGAGARSRVITEREGAPSAGQKIARFQKDVGVGGTVAGGPVRGVAPERMRIRNEVNDPRRCPRRLRSAAATITARHQQQAQYRKPNCRPDYSQDRTSKGVISHPAPPSLSRERYPYLRANNVSQPELTGTPIFESCLRLVHHNPSAKSKAHAQL
jgi:hypothetical protein